MPFSRESSQPRNRTHVSCIAGRFFTEVSYKGSLTVSQGKGSISPERRRDPKMWTEPCDRSRENDTNHLHCHLPAVYFQIKPAAAKSLQSCLTLGDPMDCGPPGSLSMGFSRQEYWSGLPFPPPGDFPDPGIKPKSLLSPESHRQLVFHLRKLRI